MKKKLKIISIIFILCLIVASIVLYFCNSKIRNFMDYNVFQKEIEEKNTTQIQLAEDSNVFTYAYGNYIIVLNNNTLIAYNSYGKEEFKLDIFITDPIFESKQNYLIIAEKNGQKLYLIHGKNIIWQTDVDGDIIRTSINKNGYVSVIVSQTTYKTVIITYGPTGKELFKYYLSNSYVIDTDISNDNKNLAIAEINVDGSAVQSGIRILSIEKLQNDYENALIYKKMDSLSKIITDIQYNNANNLIIMHDIGIDLLNKNEEVKLIEFDSDNLFADIGTKKATVLLKQKNENEQIKSSIQLLNTVTNKTAEYIIDEIAKEIITNNKNIAINTGTQIYFVSDNALLKKKYNSKQEIKKIILGESIAGVVYKNKINIIKL